MWRDPLDELIEDLEQVVKPVPAIRQIPPFELFIEISDRIIRATRYRGEPKEDPEIPRLIAKLRAYRGEGPSASPPSQEPTPDVGDPKESRRTDSGDATRDPSRT